MLKVTLSPSYILTTRVGTRCGGKILPILDEDSGLDMEIDYV